MNRTPIPWVQNPDGSQGYTWNPITGCSPASEGCTRCYAAAMAKRLQAMGAPGYENGFAVTFHPDRLDQPMKVKKPSRIFVCSMGDIANTDSIGEMPFEHILQVIQRTPRHTFLLLTKRIQRFKLLLMARDLPANVWLGVTAENQARWNERVPILMKIPAAVRFVSVEPLLEPVNILSAAAKGAGLPSWIICGKETGPHKRPFDLAWAKVLYEQCKANNIPFFWKGDGGELPREWPDRKEQPK